jgi:Peptidase family M23
MTISDNRMRIFGLILLSLLLFSNLANADYLWPLPVSKELTSNFCAYRGGHYHAGIDIRTFGKTGYNVVAVEDGYLWRVASNWWGYGNVVYLKLDNGEIAVYAHLSEFTQEVEKYVRMNQREAKRFKVNLFPEKDLFRFKKGDLIGKTGQSGVGAPHLHFEIRTAENEAIQPLRYYPGIRDGRAPRYESVTFRPIGADGTVNGSFLPHTVRFWYNRETNDYSFPEIPVICGEVGMEVKVADRRSGVERKYNVAGLKFYLNDKVVFTTSYDTLSFSTWSSLDFDYNMYQRIDGNSYYHNLYFPNGNHSPMQNNNPACENCSGMPLCTHTEPGIYDVRIVADDPAGNERIGRFKIRIVPELKICYSADDTIYSTKNMPDFRKTVLSSTHPEEDFELNISRYNPTNEEFEKTGSIKSSLREHDNAQVIYLKDIRELVGGSESTFAFISLDHTIQEKVVRSYLMGLNEGYEGKILMPDLIDRNNFIMNIDYSASHPYAWFYYKSIYRDFSKNKFFPNFLQLIGTEFPVNTLSLKLERPLEESTVGADFSSLLSDLALESLLAIGYHLKHPGIEQVFGDSTHTISLPAKHNTKFLFKLDCYSNLIDILPDDRIINDGMRITMRIPDDMPIDKAGIYGISRMRKPSFIGSDVDSTGYVSATAGSLGSYRIKIDSIPPEITKIRPQNNSTVTSSMPQISFAMKDELSGFSSDTLLIVTLDGEYLISEYDVDNKIVHSYLSTGLQTGRHELVILARDRMGNETRRNSTFIYDPSQKK